MLRPPPPAAAFGGAAAAIATATVSAAADTWVSATPAERATCCPISPRYVMLQCTGVRAAVYQRLRPPRPLCYARSNDCNSRVKRHSGRRRHSPRRHVNLTPSTLRLYVTPCHTQESDKVKPLLQL